MACAVFGLITEWSPPSTLRMCIQGHDKETSKLKRKKASVLAHQFDLGRHPRSIALSHQSGEEETDIILSQLHGMFSEGSPRDVWHTA